MFQRHADLVLDDASRHITSPVTCTIYGTAIMVL